MQNEWKQDRDIYYYISEAISNTRESQALNAEKEKRSSSVLLRLLVGQMLMQCV